MIKTILDDCIEELESLGFSDISLNEFNDTSELEDLCEKIKQCLYETYKETYSD
jgi:hypothetical protein